MAQGCDQAVNVLGFHCQVISHAVGFHTGFGVNRHNEGVITEDKEKWGEGAPLLDTASDEDVELVGGPDGEPYSHVIEEGGNHVEHPRGHANLLQHRYDEVMVNGVEGFAGIEEQDELLLSFGKGGVVTLVEFDNVVGGVPA